MKTKIRTTTFTIPASTRTRTRDDPAWGALNGGNDGITTSNLRTFESLNERISYDEPKKKFQGNCVHTRTVRSTDPSGGTYRFLDYTPPKYIRIDEGAYFWNGFLWDNRGETGRAATVRTVDWATLSAEAMEAVLPTFSEGGESIVNFMLELKKTKDLFHLWDRSKDLLRNAANGHLSYSFGWKPFISDVNRLRSALDNFRKKLRELQADSGKPKWRHYKRYLDSVDLPSKSTSSAGTVTGVGTITYSREAMWVQRPVYNATIGYTYVLPDMSIVSNQIRGFLDSLGIQLNPSIPWNAIPYSFVVDWFFDVGSWLDSLRVDNLSIPATVTDFVHSQKWEWEDQIDVNFSLRGNFHLLKVRNLRYERRRDIPSYGKLNTSIKTPDWGKFLLGASLFVQRT